MSITLFNRIQKQHYSVTIIKNKVNQLLQK
jgi:hypothetical protein